MVAIVGQVLAWIFRECVSKVRKVVVGTLEAAKKPAVFILRPVLPHFRKFLKTLLPGWIDCYVAFVHINKWVS